MNKQYSLELHKPALKNFTRRSVETYEPNDIWSIDLIDVSNIKEDNDNINFMLNIIDIYSRFAYCFPIPNKKAITILNCFKTLSVLPRNIWADEGSEFYNKDFLKFCKDNRINLYSTHSGMKSVYVERFNRTLKEILYRYFTEHNTDRYIEILPDIINDYNNKIHSTIKQSPFDVYFNDVKPYTKSINKSLDKPLFKVGDYVRVSLVKRTFEKGYSSRWSKEVFKINSIDDKQNPICYKLVDLLNEDVAGLFYPQELQKTDLKDFAIVKKIIKTKTVKGKKMYLVNYDGYPEKFDEYIDESQLRKLT